MKSEIILWWRSLHFSEKGLTLQKIIKMATAALEQRKLLIIDYLSTLEDEPILHQIENLLVPNVDFWNELNDVEKTKIEHGLNQAENGEVSDFEEFMNDFLK